MIHLHLRKKQILDVLGLFGKTIKIGKDGLMTNMNENKRNGSLAFLNGRSRCLKLTPKTFNCNIKFNDVFFDFGETFQSGCGKTWDDYKSDIPKMKKQDEEWYSTVYNHNKKIYDYGDNIAFEFFQDRKKYSPKFAYEQGLYEMSFLLSGFYYNEQKSNNFNEFIDNLTKYNDNIKLKKQITIVAEEYWND